MAMTRWTIGLRVAFAAGILLCPSPACWPQQVARQSGLLLGLADPSDEKLKYQTLWLHPSASHVNTRLLQGLVVPRQDGFWRVDSADTCSLDIEGDDGIERSVDGENNDDRRISVSIEQQEQLWFAPVGSVPHIQGISCDAINDKAARISRAAEAQSKAAGK